MLLHPLITFLQFTPEEISINKLLDVVTVLFFVTVYRVPTAIHHM